MYVCFNITVCIIKYTSQEPHNKFKKTVRPFKNYHVEGISDIQLIIIHKYRHNTPCMTLQHHSSVKQWNKRIPMLQTQAMLELQIRGAGSVGKHFKNSMHTCTSIKYNKIRNISPPIHVQWHG